MKILRVLAPTIFMIGSSLIVAREMNNSELGWAVFLFGTAMMLIVNKPD